MYSSKKGKYNSNFEKEVHSFFGKQVEYEPDKINFVQPEIARTYLPDFKLDTNIYLETKGKFTLEDRKKHLWIKEQHPEILIIFLFMNSTNKINKRSHTSYADWANENGFLWYCWKTNRPPKNVKDLIKECTSKKLLTLVKAPSPSKGTSRKKKSTTSLKSLYIPS